MNSIKGKSAILLIVVFFIGLMIVGGTFAFLSIGANITNTNYVGISTCFLVDYDIDNGDSTQDITGILFPSLGPSSGLNGRVGLNINSSCSVNGVGTLKLHINNATDSHIMEKATSHCEDKKTGEVLSAYANASTCSSAGGKWRDYPASYCEDKNTLQRLKEYTTSASCTSHNGNWVTNGSPLKYAVYNTSDTSTTPIKVGYITSSSIGSDVVIHDTIALTHSEQLFYIYVWLDGYLTDNSHAGLVFDGYISASATQAEIEYVYTVSTKTAAIGQSIPNGMVTYTTASSAMANFSNRPYPFYLKHTLENNTITESYVGFVITPEMASANPGMTAGTYELKGGDNGVSYNANKSTLLSAFGSTYCTDESFRVNCRVSGLNAGAGVGGSVSAYAGMWCCNVNDNGGSFC